MNNRDENGRSVLHWAASSGQKQLVQWLIEHNAEIDALDDSRYLLENLVIVLHFENLMIDFC